MQVRYVESPKVESTAEYTVFRLVEDIRTPVGVPPRPGAVTDGDILRWCISQFGPPGQSRWSMSRGGGCLFFRYPNDAFAFKLRWC